MTEEFIKEDRYLILKRSDIEKYVHPTAESWVYTACRMIEEGRQIDGKRELKAVVVEDDWPEHDRVWRMIKQRCSIEKG